MKKKLCEFLYLGREEVEPIIIWEDIEFLQQRREILKDAVFYVFWAENYIVVNIGYYDREKEDWQAEILAFDYKA